MKKEEKITSSMSAWNWWKSLDCFKALARCFNNFFVFSWLFITSFLFCSILFWKMKSYCFARRNNKNCTSNRGRQFNIYWRRGENLFNADNCCYLWTNIYATSTKWAPLSSKCIRHWLREKYIKGQFHATYITVQWNFAMFSLKFIYIDKLLYKLITSI